MDDLELVRKIRVRLVNELIEECFGTNFKGNLEECGTNHFRETDSYYLGYIAGKVPNPTAFHMERWECAGRFEEPDGTYLIITNPNYMERGQRFARLYEGIIGRKVKVEKSR